MGRFAKLVNTPEGMATFRAKYRIHEDVEIQYYELGEWHVRRPIDAVFDYGSSRTLYGCVD